MFLTRQLKSLAITVLGPLFGSILSLFLRVLPWAGVSCYWGFWLVCPSVVSVTTSRHATVLQAVCSEDFLLWLFFFLPSLQWPGLRQQFTTASCFIPSPCSHGGLCCCLPFRVVSLIAFLSDTVAVQVSPSSSFVVSVPGGGLRLPSVCSPSLYCSCSYSFLTRVAFLPPRIGGLFVSPSTPSRPLSPTALLSSFRFLCGLFLFVGFFSFSGLPFLLFFSSFLFFSS